MARETQKAKIERLEQELAQAQDIIKEQNDKIDSMIDKADNSFENSVTYKQMLKQIDTLELKIKSMTDSVEHNKKMYNAELKRNSELIEEIKRLKDTTVQELKMNVSDELEQLKKENAELRGKLNAGRKEKFNKDKQEEIKRLRVEGKSMQQIADILKCSKATVFNYLRKFNNK